jgi:benzoyl-CoA reductase/2-hydroxyglutaryl-CoA dehydratase subunit BcrC/BadD/HgdB
MRGSLRPVIPRPLRRGSFLRKIVAEDHCAGLKPFYNTVNESGDPFIALADGYLDQAPCARMKTLDDSVAFDGSKAAEAVAESYFQIPAEFCSMIKAIAGRLHLRIPDPIRKIIYFGSVCEPIASVLELTKTDGYDVFCIENVTSFKTEGKRPEVVKFLAQELLRVWSWLTDGKPLDEEKLREEIRRKNTISRKIRKILDLRLTAPYRRYRLQELIKKTHAKGIVSSAITGCPYGSVVQKTERDYFKGLCVPIISLETSVHKERPTEEQVMRVKTFVEMLS